MSRQRYHRLADDKQSEANMASQFPDLPETQFEPTEPELMEAFHDSRLWVQGMTFHKAMRTPLIRRALVLQVRARFDQNAARRPAQSRLF